MISGAVNDGRKSPTRKNPGPGHHSIPIASPSVRKDNQPPGGAPGLNSPDLQKTAIDGRDFRIDDPTPIRRLADRIARQLLDEICANKGN